MPENQINDPDFFRGGKAYFTVSRVDGPHYTFKISVPKKKKNPMQVGPYFVSFLTGPDNYANYTYLGMYDPANHTVRLTDKSKMSKDSVPVKTVRWAVAQVAQGADLPEGYQIQHEGKCCRCGRKLTTPESITAGIGPDCAGRM